MKRMPLNWNWVDFDVNEMLFCWHIIDKNVYFDWFNGGKWDLTEWIFEFKFSHDCLSSDARGAAQKNYAEDLKIELLKNSLIRFYLDGCVRVCVWFEAYGIASTKLNLNEKE